MDQNPIGRRLVACLLASAALPATARGQSAPARKDALTLGIDIGDTRTFDPARQIDYTPPLTLEAVYDTLVTYAPGQYQQVTPSLAATWARLPDGAAWRFKLWPDATFASGQKVTPQDVAFSLNRLVALRDMPARLMPNLAGAFVSGPDSVDIGLHDPDLSPLGDLAAPGCAILEREAVLARNGTDLANASEADRASPWLDQHSAGSGSYVLLGWDRRQAIRLGANERAWRRRPAFRTITLRHLADSTAQLRALQRGDTDAAFNLIPEHLDSLRSDDRVRIIGTTALDFAYLALNGDPALNPALASPEARQAIAAAIDYDDLINHQLGGKAVRPASFLPIGVVGSTDATAQQIGPKQDLDRARDLLRKAGQPNGFGFDIAYPDSAIAGLAYSTLARNLRRDLARVGIEVRLRPTSPFNLYDYYTAGRSQAVLAFWTEPVLDNLRWAEGALQRIGPRLHQDDPAPMLELARRAAASTDQTAALWAEWQRGMVARGNLVALFQPEYQVAVRREVNLTLTGAGWIAQLDECRLAS